MAPRVWVMNLDAEVEIEGVRGYGGLFAALAARPELEPMLALVARGSILRSPSTQARAARGHAWSMTPLARQALSKAGAVPVDAPPVHVLREVMSRAFHARLGLHFEAGGFAQDEAELERILATSSPSGAWLARRAFGFAGKGRRVFGANADRPFLDRALREGGVLVEPYVSVVRDFALHGFIDQGGGVVLGEPTATVVDRGGVWRASTRALSGELHDSEQRALVAEAEKAARGLFVAGYHGPFGIDAFRYREGFCPRCEINARYSMGWAVGMGALRPDLA